MQIAGNQVRSSKKASRRRMIIEEYFDADDILRDVGDKDSNADLHDAPENVRELNFNSMHDHNANFSDIASELENL
jgi:hypothetical protein